MSIKIAINGFGRIGRLTLRAIIERTNEPIQNLKYLIQNSGLFAIDNKQPLIQLTRKIGEPSEVKLRHTKRMW